MDVPQGYVWKDTDTYFFLLKFIYSEKATKFYEIFPLLLTTVHTVKSKGVDFSECSKKKYVSVSFHTYPWGTSIDYVPF